ncbi:hypothetical protein TNCV_47061 [Trichonephila clavipes]|nr:hypothetical protein TNCV_47061 [Trichonephila clavipes]
MFLSGIQRKGDGLHGDYDPRHGLRSESASCCERRRTVRSDTCCLANDSNSLLRVSDEAARCIRPCV